MLVTPGGPALQAQGNAHHGTNESNTSIDGCRLRVAFRTLTALVRTIEDIRSCVMTIGEVRLYLLHASWAVLPC